MQLCVHHIHGYRISFAARIFNILGASPGHGLAVMGFAQHAPGSGHVTRLIRSPPCVHPGARGPSAPSEPGEVHLLHVSPTNRTF